MCATGKINLWINCPTYLCCDKNFFNLCPIVKLENIHEIVPIGTNMEPNMKFPVFKGIVDSAKLLILMEPAPGLEPGTY